MSIYSDLRRRHPYLTPPFVGEDEQVQPRRPAVRVAFGDRGLTGVKPPMPLPSVTPPEMTLPERNPYEGYTPEPSKPSTPNIRVGAPNTTGLSPIDRSVAALEAQRQAATDYPSSKVSSTGEILPPHMHHGFKDRLKSIGRGALLGLQAGGPGGAIAGAITGGVSPVTIDKIQAQRALQRRTAEVDQQLDIETRRAKLEDLRRPPTPQKPVYETRSDAEGNKIRQQWNPQTGKLEDVLDESGNPIIVERPRVAAGTDEREVGGRILKRQPDGSWKVTYESPTSGGPDYATRAEWYYKQQHEAEANAEALRKQAAAIQPQAGYDLDKSQAAEKEDLLRRATAAENDAKDYRVKGDEASTAKGASTKQAGDTRKGTISKQQKELWLKDNPGKTVDDLKKLYPNAVIAN